MEATDDDPSCEMIPLHATEILPFLEVRKLEMKEKLTSVVTIGILDTGIDPAIFHNDPLCKLIDIVDCTSSGDVDVTHECVLEKVLDPDNPLKSYHYEVKGLTGRILKLSKSLNVQPFPSYPDAASSDTVESTEQRIDKSTQKLVVRLGILIGYHLFPKALVKLCRSNSNLRKKEVDQYVAMLHQKLSDWNSSYSSKKNNVPFSAIRQRDDWNAQLDVLEKFRTGSDDENDPGPVYDCVVFWDGTNFRAAIDVFENGDLRLFKALTAFGIEHEYGTFPVPTTLDDIHNVNFGIQFYNQGKLLSIVTDCSPHGTHVAQIAATIATSGVTYSAERKGPVVHLISFKIGDPRLGTMETGSALIRAIQLASATKLYHCDVINISYGEAVVHATSGKRMIECVNDCVWKYNTMIVCAAGNHGPALTTNNAPGGVFSSCISIAAVVTPIMQEKLYGLLPHDIALNQNIVASNDNTANKQGTVSNELDTTYAWSSVGPTSDGDWGVNLCAPGGAIASVPQWCMTKSQLMNGTSMACPHSTGCVALLLAACKTNNFSYTVARIRRALENTAQLLPNRSPLEQGRGLIQVNKAWAYIQAHIADPVEDVGFDVKILHPYDSNYSSPRGIYLRGREETDMLRTYTIGISPKFCCSGDGPTISQKKINFELTVMLTSASPWVKVAKSIVLTSDCRSFDIEVDPTRLGPGLHTSFVAGVITHESKEKILFTVPISITKPILPAQRIVELSSLVFEIAEIKRFYVLPPLGSTWMDITIIDEREEYSNIDGTRRSIVLHTVQLLGHAAYRDNECNKRLSLAAGQSHISSIPIQANILCEIALARNWTTRLSTAIDVRVQFRGILPSPNEINMYSGSGGAMIRAYNELSNEVINPSGKLTKWQVPLRPVDEGTITPLVDDRDTMDESKKSYELSLTYKFEQEEKGKFIARAPTLQGVLYDSAFESQCMLIFDGDKKFLGMSDTYPSSISTDKGTVIIRMQVRHVDPAKLETMKDLIIWIERDLDKEIPLSIYNTKEDMMLGVNKMAEHTIAKTASTSVFFSEPENSRLPTHSPPGSRFIGSFSLEGGDELLPGASKRPGGYLICYTAGPNKNKKEPIEATVTEPTVKLTLEQKLNFAVRDLKIEHLSKINVDQNGSSFIDLWDKMVLEYPDYIPIYLAKLKYLDEHPKRGEHLVEIIDTAKDIINRISEDDLAKGLGRNVDVGDGDSVQKNKDLLVDKDCLIESLVRLAFAVADTEVATFDDTISTTFDDTIRHLRLWIDFESSPKCATLQIIREMRVGMYGLALKHINNILENEAKAQSGTIRPMSRASLLSNRMSIYEKLGLDCMRKNEIRVQAISCPKSYYQF